MIFRVQSVCNEDDIMNYESDQVAPPERGYLENLDLKSLKELKVDVERAIDREHRNRHKRMMQQLSEVARSYGYGSLQEALSGKSGRKSTSVRLPQFQHPEDHSKTWTGLGRRPIWMNEALESGYTLDDLRI